MTMITKRVPEMPYVCSNPRVVKGMPSLEKLAVDGDVLDIAVGVDSVDSTQETGEEGKECGDHVEKS